MIFYEFKSGFSPKQCIERLRGAFYDDALFKDYVQLVQ